MNVCVGGKFGYKLKFIENNKEWLRKIREKRYLEIDLEFDSSEEENSSSDFVDI